MSRDSYSICRPCGVFQDNGIVLNATAMDRYETVAAFDADAAGTPKPNEAATRTRAFLAEHEAHGVEYWSWDWAYGEDDPLGGLVEVNGPPDPVVSSEAP